MTYLTEYFADNKMEPVNFEDQRQGALRKINQLVTLVSQLQQGISTAPPLPSLPPRVSPGIPIAVHERYNGDPGQFQVFLMQCRPYIDQHQEMFMSDTDCIHFVTSLWMGRAWDWVITLWT